MSNQDRQREEERLRLAVADAYRRKQTVSREERWHGTDRLKPIVETVEVERTECPTCHHVERRVEQRELGWGFSGDDTPRTKDEALREAKEADARVDEANAAYMEAFLALDDFRRAPERERDEARRQWTERREARMRQRREEYFRRHPTARLEEGTFKVNTVLRQIRRRLTEEG